MRVNAQLYGQFLVSSQVNYTGPYLANHLDGLTHDNGRYFLPAALPPCPRPPPLTHDNGRYFLKTQRFAPRHGRCRTGKQRPLAD